MLRFDGAEVRQAGWTLRADLMIPERAVTAVIGPSGAGKSTLLNAVAGFQPLSAGRILWRGTDISALHPSKRPVAMIFQDNNLFTHLTAVENVALALTQKTRIGAEARSRAEAALHRVGLDGLGDRKPGQLSGGQQSRVALARVLLQARPLLLLDEPFSALGPALRAEMLDLVRTVATELQATVMIVTHDPADARRIAPQTVTVLDGVAAPPRDTSTLLDAPPPDLQDYLGH